MPTIEVTLAYVKACGADPAVWSARWRAAADALASEPSSRQERKPPYLGLTTFEPADANLFFGRRPLVEQLCENLAESSFVAVFGPSGSGKSSLLRAGLIPALRERDPDVTTVLLSPGAHPPADLVAPGDRTKRLVVVVDQFEEIFTLCQDATERTAFIEALLMAVETDDRVQVVLGVRADFYGRCADHPPLVEALRDHQVLIGAMTEEQLRSVIVNPAEHQGLKVEAGLVETIVAEVAGQPDALPLVSHALLETWHRRRGQTLTLAAYRAAGGVRGAIAKTADHAYQDFGPEERQLAKEVFLRLTALGEGTEDTRRRVDHEELLGTGRRKTMAAVLERLAQARLVALDENTVTVTHEALIRGWPALRSWLIEERQLLRSHRSLTEAAAEWDRHDREGSFLYRGLRLDTYHDFPENRLNDLERAFLSAGRTTKSLERAERRRRLRLTTIKGAAMVVVLPVLVLLVIVQINWTAGERDIAQSRELAAAVRSQLDRDPQLALLLADEAVNLSPTAEAVAALRQAIADDKVRAVTPTGHGPAFGVAFSRSGRLVATSGADGTVRLWPTGQSVAPAPPRLLRGLRGPASAPVFSPDDRYLAAASPDGTIAVWDPAHADVPARLLRGHDGEVRGVAFSPDGRRLASAGQDGTVRIWDLADTEQPQVLRQPAAARSVAFSPDGRQVAGGGSDGVIRLWPVTGDAAPRTLTGHGGAVETVAFSPDGQVLASGGTDSMVRIWHLAGDPQPLALAGHNGTVETVAFSPDGQVLASGGSDGMVRVWSATGNIDPLVLSGHTGTIWGVAFSPDGNQVASVGQDGVLRTWDPAGLGGQQTLRTGHGAVSDVVLNGEQVAAGADDGTVHVWDLTTGRDAVLTGHVGAVRSIAYSPDGHQLASAGDDGTIHLWNPTTGQHTTLTGHVGPIHSLAYQPDGHRLASAGDDGTVHVWDLTTGRDAVLTGHVGAVWSVSFSTDGGWLASSGQDGTLRLWQPDGKGEPVVLRSIGAAVSQMAFVPDQRLMTADTTGVVRIWRCAVCSGPPELRRLARERKIRELTPAERQTFLPDGKTSN
ncbi:hypothetical protein [Amycolatopsis sp. RTGN1]|uniref:nSTAND1 domain-containing NTPase n=1 Tax=Amycolatopsis ponsaeliensis TaxID=2992142 RepID=UPI00254E90F4|nr:hypothetical protein [Amycolatopsis sp. RTGN1]